MRSITIISLCLSILLTTAGCANKADKGEGGFAEHNYSNSPNHPIGLENALYFELQLAQRHLDALLMAGANICFPASVKKATLRQTRVARELQGGLPGDAANDLIIQRDQLARLERRLNYVQLQDSCLPTKSYKGNDPGNMIEERGNKESKNLLVLSAQHIKNLDALLNNNNQFVFNSALLNPRYIGQLSEATQILASYPQYHLKLTGHSDVIGTDLANLKVSLERATQVERYLLIFGLNPNNIEINASGAKEPLFDDKQPQVRLVNRRVSIELIDTSSSSEVTPK